MRKLLMVLAVVSDGLVVWLAGWAPVLVLAVWQIAYFEVARRRDVAMRSVAALVYREAKLFESSLRHPAAGDVAAQIEALGALWMAANEDSVEVVFGKLSDGQKQEALIRAGVTLVLALGDDRVKELATEQTERGHPTAAAALRWLIA